MSQRHKANWFWRYPKPPYGCRWPSKAEVRPRFVTRNDMAKNGVPFNAPIEFISQRYWDALPASMAEDDKPMTWDQFQAFMTEVRPILDAEEARRSAGAGQDRPLNAKQIVFAEALAAGHSPSAAYRAAGYAQHRSNPLRLARDPRVIAHLAKLANPEGR